jgi:lipoprotein-releasing system permease protein
MWFLSIRYLFSQKRQTALTLVGIVLGTSAYVVISGMMLGFQNFIIDQLVNNDSHIRISARNLPVNSEELTKTLFESDTYIRWLREPSGKRDSPYIIYPRG